MTTIAKKGSAGLSGIFGGRSADDKNPLEALSLPIWRVTCMAWAIEKLLSWRIWTTYRMLPAVPVFNVLANAPAIFHTLLFVVSLLLIFTFIIKANSYLIAILLAVEVCQCVLDQNRVQPWEYQYFFIAALFISYRNDRRVFAASVAFVLVSTYFYSGINKLNEGFLQSVWSNLILGQFLRLPAHWRHQGWLYYSGYLVGMIEALIGVGLLFRTTQKISAILLIAMHLIILIIWGPFGLKGYQILWFWNASMIALLYLVFLRGQIDMLPALTSAWKRPVILFWGVLPAFSFAGLWPKNLSSNMFSGNTPWMVICVNDLGRHQALERFSTSYSPRCVCRGALKIDLQGWAVRETRVSVNPERRLMFEMQQRLRQQYPDCKFTFFIIDGNNQARQQR